MPFDVGDRIQVKGKPHEPGQDTGTIALINPGPAYGIRFNDGGDDMGGEIHKWYVADELTPAGASRSQGGHMETELRAQMSAASVNDLPDSAFAYIEPGGSKDESGRTVPRSLRHFPIHDAAHVRNALARAPQSPFGEKAMPKIMAAAKKFGIEVSDMPRSHMADNLVRAVTGPDAAGMRSGRTLFGHFGVFDEWTEINSAFEGRFLERNQPGSFSASITGRRDRIKALYDHGKDPMLGNKPLGRFLTLEEDERGGYYEIDLLDTSYNDDFVIPAARAGLLGSSYRFSIPDGGDAWDKPMRPTKWNPDKLPERTVVKADVYELGPVTFPAYAGTSASIRSTTDEFLDHLASDPRFVARFTERAGLVVVERLLAALPPAERAGEFAEPPAAPSTSTSTQKQEDVPADGHASPSSAQSRMKYAMRSYVTLNGVGKKFK